MPILVAAADAVESLASGMAAIVTAVHKNDDEELEEQRRYDLAMAKGRGLLL